jgi:hypothetical protein
MRRDVAKLRFDGSGTVVDVQEGSRPCVSGHQRLESVWGCLSNIDLAVDD